MWCWSFWWLKPYNDLKRKEKAKQNKKLLWNYLFANIFAKFLQTFGILWKKAGLKPFPWHCLPKILIIWGFLVAPILQITFYYTHVSKFGTNLLHMTLYKSNEHNSIPLKINGFMACKNLFSFNVFCYHVDPWELIPVWLDKLYCVLWIWRGQR